MTTNVYEIGFLAWILWASRRAIAQGAVKVARAITIGGAHATNALTRYNETTADDGEEAEES